MATAGSTRNTLPAPRAAVQELLEETVATRRHLHRHAELSTEEHETQRFILDKLEALGLEDVRAVADTGATALVRGALPGPNLLWRADIDALPLNEDTGLPFASENGGVMHACGHDGHVAIALALAAALQARRESLSGTVRLAFQPAEERVGGARRMLEAGILADPRVDQIFGLHIIADIPTGDVRVKAGAIMAAATHFRIIIRGKGGHAASPHETVDPIVVGAHAIVALQTVVSRNVDPQSEAVVTIGRFQGGVRGNIIPDEVMMSGSIRTFDPSVLERVLRRVDEILRGVTSAFEASYQFDHSTLPAVMNDAESAALVEAIAAAFLGPERVAESRLTGADDMAFFLEAAPGAYFFLGGGKAAGDATYPHHNPKFDFDEACLPLGVEIAIRLIEAASASPLG